MALTGDAGRDSGIPGVEAGAGRAQLVDQHALRLGVLRGLSNFLEAHTDPGGGLRCPVLGLEPTGRIVQGALINLSSWRFTREDEYAERARRQVLRAVDQLSVDPLSGAEVFPPGAADERNDAGFAEDGGACVDVIVSLLRGARDLFSDDEAARAQAAVERHVETFLLQASTLEHDPVERAWAALGLARAGAAFGREPWCAAARAACAGVLRSVDADGVVPMAAGPGPGAERADVSSARQGVVPALLLAARAALGADWDPPDARRLGAMLDALLALRGGEGRKLLRNEVDSWRWDGPYEVASHPFDVYALHRGAALLGRPELDAEAGRAMEEWVAHLHALDGGVESHHGAARFTGSRVGWSAQGAWIARVIHSVPIGGARGPRDVECGAAGLLHVERDGYVALLRGAHAAPTCVTGCDVGGGQLQSLVLCGDTRRVARRECIVLPARGAVPDGSAWVQPDGAAGRGAVRRALREAEGWAWERAARRERAARAAGRRLEAWRRRRAPRACLARVVRSGYVAAWDVGTQQEYDGERVLYRGGVADWRGARLPGARTERRYGFGPGAVTLQDVVLIEGVVGRLGYRLPAALGGVELQCDGGTLQRRDALVQVTLDGTAVRFAVTGEYAVS